MKQVAASYCDGAELKLNWWAVSGGCQKIFYYDALPARKPSQSDKEFELERKIVEELHARLSTFDRFRVNEGDTRYRKGRGLEQKKVDVMIAVDMMIHTIRRNMSEAQLMAGDADFTPLLNALSNEGMFVTLIHPPKASKDLLAAADARITMTVRQIYDWVDDASKPKFGIFPYVSFGDASHDANCQHVWSDGSTSVEVWLNLSDRTTWASWLAPERSDRFSLRGGNWKITQQIALDDYGTELPTEPPPGFGGL